MKQPGEPAQRVRLRFSRSGGAAFISHLDMMRFWERAFRRAGLPLAYSQGFSAHPRISIAAPLPLGVTSEAELMDVFLNRWVPPHSILQRTRPVLPSCLGLDEATTVPSRSPSLQSLVREAEYRVSLVADKGPQHLAGAIASLLSATTLMWQHVRDTGVRSYDLRPLVLSVWPVEHTGAETVVGMRLVCGPKGSGRPEQVTAAMGFPAHPLLVHRTRLLLEPPGALQK